MFLSGCYYVHDLSGRYCVHCMILQALEVARLNDYEEKFWEVMVFTEVFECSY